jgi:hypothetical protein
MKQVFSSWLKVLWLASVSISLDASAQVDHVHDLMPVRQSVSSGIGRLVIDFGFRISVVGHCEPWLYAYASRVERRLGEKTGIFLDRQRFVTAADSADPIEKLIQAAAGKVADPLAAKSSAP